MSSTNNEDHAEVIKGVNDGYYAWTQWLIALAGGVIVFSINLIRPGIPGYSGFLLVWGLVSLLLSLLAGVLGLRARLDAKHYDAWEQRNKNKVNQLNVLEANSSECNKVINDKESLEFIRLSKIVSRRFDMLSMAAAILMPFQLWTFVIGVGFIAIFGIFSVM